MKIKKTISLLLSLSLIFSLSVTPAGAQSPLYLRGDTDFNGKITNADYLAVRLFLSNQGNLKGNTEQAADVDGDNLINSTDALVMLQHLLGIKYTYKTYMQKLWSHVPMTSATQSAMGIVGGEGCQVPQYITFNDIYPNIAYMGTDVGGFYRSTDSGVTWQLSSIGLSSSGAACVKIDPNNGNRLLVCGVNSAVNPMNGLNLSTDCGVTFTPVLTNLSFAGKGDRRDSIAFDPSSYSKSVGGSAIAYWVFEDGTIYKTTDGCNSWSVVCSNEDFANGHIFIHPQNSTIYLASEKGFFRSTDGGVNFTQILTESITGIDVINTCPDNIYLSSHSGTYISTDCGLTFTHPADKGLPTYPTRIEVSPVNPDYMVVDDDHIANTGSYVNQTYYSHDGGNTWTVAGRDTSLSITPFNARSNGYAWSPTDQNLCLSFGGDMILRSTDGGKNFVWSNSGFGAATVTDISYNLNNPSLMATTNQDYKGFISKDFGRTWEYVNAWSDNRWGGYAYGSYPVTNKIMVGLVGTSWHSDRTIYYSTDGGKTGVNTGLVVTVINKIYRVTGMKGDNNIVFANDYRSSDKGKTWTKMDNCVAVFGGTNSIIYGINNSQQIVSSSDKGVSWEVMSNYAAGVMDMVYDPKSDRLLVTSEKKVSAVNCDNGHYYTVYDFSEKKDGYGRGYILRSIEVDPTNSDVIFVANSRMVYASDIGLLKSTDGGKTWVNLNSTRNNIYYGDNGGSESGQLCIIPQTRQLFTASSCRGIFKMAVDQ